MADLKLAYAASAALTCTLESLATSSTLVAGRESTAVVNTSNLYLDYLLSGRVKLGTSPTDAKVIEVWVYASLEDTPTYPDSITGSDAAATLTSVNIKNAALALAASMVTANVTGRIYPFRPVSIASLFGGVVPKRWGVWVSHNTGVNLDASAGGTLWQTPVYATG